MPNTREKLIELFRGIAHENCFGSIEGIADYLIANGVTVQKWIPVRHELPQDGVPVLVYVYMNDDIQKVTHRGNRWYSTWDNTTEIVYVSHWMPLPEPPKEEKPFHYEKGNQPRGAEQFAKACAVCVNYESALCKDCKAEKKSGFEPPF